MTHKEFFNTVLYKFISYVDSFNNLKNVLPISSGHRVNCFLSPLSTEIEEDIYYLEIIDINESLVNNQLTISELVITNADDFISSMITGSNKENDEYCKVIKLLIQNESSFLTQRIKSHTRTLCVLNKILNNEKVSSSAITIGNNDNLYTAIVYNTIDGIKKDLSDDQINNIGNIIVKFILDNGQIDLSDDELVDSIIRQLEVIIIDSCPSWIIAEKVHINKDAIKNEINKLQEWK